MELKDILPYISGQVEIIQNCDTTLFYGDAKKALSEIGNKFVSDMGSFINEDGEYVFVIHTASPNMNSF